MALEVPRDQSWDEGEILVLCVFRGKGHCRGRWRKNDGGDGGSSNLPSKLKKKMCENQPQPQGCVGTLLVAGSSVGASLPRQWLCHSRVGVRAGGPGALNLQNASDLICG